MPIAAIVLVRGRRQRYESPCDAVEVVCTLARSRTAESGPNESRSNSRERPRLLDAITFHLPVGEDAMGLDKLIDVVNYYGHAF